MNYFITFAKTLMVIIWILLLSNIFFPFPGKAELVFYILLGFVIFLHLIQLLMIYGAFSEKLKLTKSETLQVFIFGVFKLWQIKGRLQ
jgi:putative membrane protein